MTVRVPVGEARGRGSGKPLCGVALRQPAAQGVDVELRRFPYPYEAMLAICSDLDMTPDRDVYGESMRFLNTTQTTRMGPGVGLEVGNTIYFDMPPDQFSYWNTDDAGRAMIRRLIRSGHVDCLHSFGDLATTRAHAARALEELARHDCRIDVWVDHSKAPSNFGADIMVGSGDVRGAPVYHADLTLDYGITYVWRGRTTSIIGQNVPRKLGGLFNARHPLGSSRTVAKQAVKIALAGLGNVRYAMHAPNDIARFDSLRDGQRVREFLRCNPHWRGVGQGATAAGLADVLTKQFLECLVRRRGVCILYTHLGKIDNPLVPFAPPTVNALRRLSEYGRDGKILVTTTRRLLGYDRALREVTVEATLEEDGLRIDVGTAVDRPSAGERDGRTTERSAIAGSQWRDSESAGSGLAGSAWPGWKPVPHDDLAGLTFYVSDPIRTRVFVDGEAIEHVRHNQPDHTGRASVSLPRPALEFPDP